MSASLPLELTQPQSNMLIFVRWSGEGGHDALRLHPVLAALERRGLVEHRGSRAAPRLARWHATDAGRQWVADQHAPPQVVTPSDVWSGTPSDGSRWTVQQLSVLNKHQRDPDTIETATILRRPRVNADDWTMPPKPVEVVMPRLAVTRDGRRAKVVTPGGAERWLDVARG